MSSIANPRVTSIENASDIPPIAYTQGLLDGSAALYADLVRALNVPDANIARQQVQAVLDDMAVGWQETSEVLDEIQAALSNPEPQVGPEGQ